MALRCLSGEAGVEGRKALESTELFRWTQCRHRPGGRKGITGKGQKPWIAEQKDGNHSDVKDKSRWGDRPMLSAVLFTTVKTWRQPVCPLTDEWIKKMWYIYTMEHYSAIQKNEIMPFAATWMDLEVIILREVRKMKTNII